MVGNPNYRLDVIDETFQLSKYLVNYRLTI